MKTVVPLKQKPFKNIIKITSDMAVSINNLSYTQTKLKISTFFYAQKSGKYLSVTNSQRIIIVSDFN